MAVPVQPAASSATQEEYVHIDRTSPAPFRDMINACDCPHVDAKQVYHQLGARMSQQLSYQAHVIRLAARAISVTAMGSTLVSLVPVSVPASNPAHQYQLK
jgi:hypothetical protein